MEHREPPRIVAGERQLEGAVPEPGEHLRLRRFETLSDRHMLEYVRAGLLATAAALVMIALVCFAYSAIQGAIGWLHHQPKYEVPFSQIRLVSPPPDWYRGGSSQFLERVRLAAGEAERVSVLDVAPDRLALAFKNYAWVEQVSNVRYEPGRVTVDLRFRQPVAWADVPGGRQQIVDEKAILLPLEDVDVDRLGHVVKVFGEGLPAPWEPRAGVVWKTRRAGSDIGEPEPSIIAAAKLAGFLRSHARVRVAAASPALLVIQIIVTYHASRGLFMMNAEGTEIRWGPAPGDELPGKLTAQEKWSMLADWANNTRARLIHAGDYWAFARRGLAHVCTHPGSPHQPREPSVAGKDQPAGKDKGG